MLKSLAYIQGVVEKKNTLPILSNVLLEAKDACLRITATDLDLIFIHQLKNVEVLEEGTTTTTSSTLYDIVRKLSSGKKINLTHLMKRVNYTYSQKNLILILIV